MIRTIPHGINIAGRLGFYFQIYCRLDPAQHQHCGRLGFTWRYFAVWILPNINIAAGWVFYLYRSCTTPHNRGLGSRWSGWSICRWSRLSRCLRWGSLPSWGELTIKSDHPGDVHCVIEGWDTPRWVRVAMQKVARRYTEATWYATRTAGVGRSLGAVLMSSGESLFRSLYYARVKTGLLTHLELHCCGPKRVFWNLISIICPRNGKASPETGWHIKEAACIPLPPLPSPPWHTRENPNPFRAALLLTRTNILKYNFTNILKSNFSNLSPKRECDPKTGLHIREAACVPFPPLPSLTYTGKSQPV